MQAVGWWKYEQIDSSQKNLQGELICVSQIGVTQNGWFTMENPIKMDDLGGKPTILGNTQLCKDPRIPSMISLSLCHPPT